MLRDYPMHLYISLLHVLGLPGGVEKVKVQI
jgi:hypothetical protein